MRSLRAHTVQCSDIRVREVPSPSLQSRSLRRVLGARTPPLCAMRAQVVASGLVTRLVTRVVALTAVVQEPYVTSGAVTRHVTWGQNYVVCWATYVVR